MPRHQHRHYVRCRTDPAYPRALFFLHGPPLRRPGVCFSTIGGINMLFIIWIVVGGILGWLASLVMKTDAEQGMILNVVVGIIGSFLGGWLLSPLFGTGTINSDDFSITSLLVSFLGAVILLAIVNLLRRGKAR